MASGERPLSEVRFLTVAEAAAMMRVPKMVIYRLVHSGELPAIRVGRSFRIPRQALLDYMQDAGVIADSEAEFAIAMAGHSKVGKSGYMSFGDGRYIADSISVSIYLDTDDAKIAQRVARSVDELVDAMGYEGPIDVETKRGSFMRRSGARIKKTLTSPEVASRLTKVERALEAYTVESKQVDIDGKSAKVVSDLLGALADVPNACIKAGSTLLIKYEENGRSVVLSRQLSQLEIRAWERFPEIQKNPHKAIQALSLAVESLGDPEIRSG